MTAVVVPDARTAVLFDPASPVHRLSEPGVTGCDKPVPAGARTAPEHTALVSAHVYHIALCVGCYPTELARRNGPPGRVD